MDWTKIKLVSLDVDGTLYSLPAMKWHFSCLLLKQLVRSPARVSAEMKRIRKFHRTVNFLRRHRNPFDPAKELELLAVEQELLPRWYGEAIALAGPRAGLLPFLEQLKQRGIEIVACSDFRCDYKLSALGVDKYFAHSYVGSTSGEFKPNPSIMKRILQEAGLTSSEVLHIGDHQIKDGSWGTSGLCQTYIIRDSFHELL